MSLMFNQYSSIKCNYMYMQVQCNTKAAMCTTLISYISHRYIVQFLSVWLDGLTHRDILYSSFWSGWMDLYTEIYCPAPLRLVGWTYTHRYIVQLLSVWLDALTHTDILCSSTRSVGWTYTHRYIVQLLSVYWMGLHTQIYCPAPLRLVGWTYTQRYIVQLLSV